jgi:hypothetical protein
LNERSTNEKVNSFDYETDKHNTDWTKVRRCIVGTTDNNDHNRFPQDDQSRVPFGLIEQKRTWKKAY